MAKVSLQTEDIPHGHGLSFKRGISDGLLGINKYSSQVHETHKHSYRRGQEIGEKLKDIVAGHVKKSPSET